MGLGYACQFIMVQADFKLNSIIDAQVQYCKQKGKRSPCGV